MSSQPTFWRSPRLQTLPPADQVVIPPPPAPPQPPAGSLLYSLVPLSSVLLVVAFYLGYMFMFKQQGGAFIWAAPIAIGTSLAPVAIHILQKRAFEKEIVLRTERYNAFLQEMTAQLQQLADKEQQIRQHNNPSAASCFQHVQARHRVLWSRDEQDEDFLAIRVGTGRAPSTITVVAPTVTGGIDSDPLIDAAQVLQQQFSQAQDVPICLPLTTLGNIGISGDRARVWEITALLLLQVATFHAPDQVKIGALFAKADAPQWSWLRWLPHSWDEAYTQRYLADDLAAMQNLLRIFNEELNRRQQQQVRKTAETISFPKIVLIITDLAMVKSEPVIQRLQYQGPVLGLYTIFLGDRIRSLPPDCQATIRIQDHEAHLIILAAQATSQRFRLDTFDPMLPERFAREMASIRYMRAGGTAIPARVSLLELYAVHQIEELKVGDRWQKWPGIERALVARLGMAMGHEPLILDLHEQRHGPNGLVAGMVGVGKSELLQTLVLSLALEYQPHALTFALVDYKGGDMARALTGLPHVVGVITNLEERALATRALTSFQVEAKRRQELLKAANLDHIDAYQQRFAAGHLSEPLAYLLIIVDEFAELRDEHPELAAEFVRIARIGRALGMCLILATQKPAGIVDGQIEANTRFRLCLRVAQPEDSQAMLKKPDAAYLVGRGRAYLQVGVNESFSEFQVAWSGAPYEPTATASDALAIVEVALDGSRKTLYRPTAKAVVPQTQLQAICEHLQAVASQARIEPLPRLWLQPLPSQLFLSTIRPKVGWDGAMWHANPIWLAPMVGLLDEPHLRRQTVLRLDLAKLGHVRIYGAPGYGKTTLLQTMIVALVQDHSPAEINLYLLDFGDRMLQHLLGFPHVGDVILPHDVEKLERFWRMLQRQLAERQHLFGEIGVTTLPDYRNHTGNALPAILVVIDNYGNFYRAIQQNEAVINDLAHFIREGANFGIHFVLAAHTASDIRYTVASSIEMALTFYQVEPSEYTATVGRPLGNLPAAIPGRALLRSQRPIEFQVALPVAGDQDLTRNERLSVLSQSMKTSWQGTMALPIATLPSAIRLSDLWRTPQTSSDTNAIVVGLYKTTLALWQLDYTRYSSLLISGAQQSGKSIFLQTAVRSLAHQLPPDDLQIYLFASRRNSLAAVATLPQVQVHTTQADQSDEPLSKLASLLAERREHFLVSSQLKAAWPLILIIVDDLLDPFDEGLSEQGRERLATLIHAGRGLRTFIIVAGTTNELSARGWQEPVKTLKATQIGVVLGNSDDAIFNLRLPVQYRNRLLPPGEGYFVNRTTVESIKFALPE